MSKAHEPKITEHDRAYLSEAELAAIDEDDDVTDIDDNLDESENKDVVDKKESDEDDAEEEADKTKTAKEKPEGRDTLKESEVVEEEEDKTVGSNLPQFDVGNKTELETKLTEIKDQLKELRAKFTKGDLSEEQYYEKYDELKDLQTDIKIDIRDAENFEKINSKNSQTDLDTIEQKFFAEKGNQIYQNDIAFNALNAAFTKIAEKEPTLSHAQKLKKASLEVKKTFGLAANDEPKKEESKPKQEKRQQKTIPDSLAGESSAADHADGGKYAHLDNLKGLALEAALAKMTPAQVDEWERA